ncbi:MAG TPA: hypothetical protein VGH99_02380 [Pseudonocardia sp.]|jgi:hypothetical protein
MLTAFDDYPVHQTPLPLAQPGGGHPDFYDRFWFNGYTEDAYFAVALGTYPNRGVIDAAFSVVADGVQRSVFASGRAPLERAETAVGPIRVRVVEPMRAAEVEVDAPEQGLRARLRFDTRTPVCEEKRHTRHAGARLVMDVTRATQLGRWSGELTSGDRTLRADGWFGTKDRSWGVRSVGDPAPMAPVPAEAQYFFLWAPLHFDVECLHYMVFEDADGEVWGRTAARLPVIGAGDPVVGPELGIAPLSSVSHEVRWAKGLRRGDGATLRVRRAADGPEETVELEPLVTFRMSGAGYFHPDYPHGRWHDELMVAGEEFAVVDLDNTEARNIHVQQVVRARRGGVTGLGVLEQLVFGPHAPSGFTDLLGGHPG